MKAKKVKDVPSLLAAMGSPPAVDREADLSSANKIVNEANTPSLSSQYQTRTEAVHKQMWRKAGANLEVVVYGGNAGTIPAACKPVTVRRWARIPMVGFHSNKKSGAVQVRKHRAASIPKARETSCKNKLTNRAWSFRFETSFIGMLRKWQESEIKFQASKATRICTCDVPQTHGEGHRFDVAHDATESGLTLTLSALRVRCTANAATQRTDAAVITGPK
jgi:hypothetical protein